MSNTEAFTMAARHDPVSSDRCSEANNGAGRSESLMRLYRIAAVAGFMIAAVPPAAAQNLLTPEKPAFRSDSPLVLVPITVVDGHGAIVNGLSSEAFTLTEDGVRQQISSFSEEDAPVSMGIVLDLSGSMKRVLGDAKESLRSLLADANPSDEAFLNAVSTSPRPFSGFTRDFFGDILGRVAFEPAGGDTALVDTVFLSLQGLRTGVHTRKALLVISDGMDNHSRYSKGELLDLAMESDARIYTMAVGDPAKQFSKPMERMEENRGRLFLDELSSRTGGLSFVVRGREDIAAAAAHIGQALRNQYTIGYMPVGKTRQGQWRRIKVTVAGSGMKAYARTGYRND
jgi:Ca-activated chloride channel family protein